MELGRDILFLEKIFLRRAPAALRGVELFNIQLLRDLHALGHRIAVPAHPSWRAVFAAQFAGLDRLAFRYGARRGGALNLAAWAWWIARGPRRDLLLLGNVGNLLVPLVRTARCFRKASRYVLIAHRETSPRFLAALQGWAGAIVAVNGKIAEPFRAAGFPEVHVDYGIMNADRFFPRAEAAADAAPVRFCVVGMLDNAWKGADTATAAFRAMPEAARRRCELHLASYSEPPRFEEPNIIALPWMPASEIPAWLRTMDVMLCPSRDEVVMRETFSQAVVQGMLSGLPVLASDLPIFREKLDGGGGAVFTDVADFAAKMTALVNDPALRARQGREGRATALARYVWDTARFARRYFG